MVDQKVFEEDLLSIVIPVYNGSKYIEETIRTILASSYSKLEIIIIDDGSEDESFKIVSNLAREDKRIKLFYKENGGIISARNYGVKIATGSYICFCDQDDLISKDMYLKMVKTLKNDESQICICSTGRLIEREIVPFESYSRNIYENEEIKWGLLYPLLFGEYNVLFNKESKRIYASIWKCIFDRRFFEKYEFRFKRFVDFEDDLIMFVETLLKAKKVSTVSEIFYVWRVNFKSESYNHKYFSDLLNRQNRFSEYMLNELEKNQIPDEVVETYNKVLACRNYVSLLDNLANGRKLGNKISVRKYISENIYDDKFNKNVQMYSYLKKGYVKPRILLKLLMYHRTFITYVVNIALNNMVVLTLKFSWLNKVERRLKKLIV